MSEARKAICGSPDREQVHVMAVHLDASGKEVKEQPWSQGGLSAAQADALFQAIVDAVNNVMDGASMARGR